MDGSMLGDDQGSSAESKAFPLKNTRKAMKTLRIANRDRALHNAQEEEKVHTQTNVERGPHPNEPRTVA